MTVTELHPDTAQHPLRDPALEAAFARHGVDTWSFDPALDVASVDKERSLANQARLEPLNIEIVERYAEDMAAGDTFPPVVVERQRTARQVRLVAIGGNHRLAAARIAKRATLAAYVVEGDAPALYRLMWEDNRRHGFPPGDKERLMAAAHLVDSGDSMAEAARTVGISYAKVTEHFAALRADRKAVSFKIRGWDALPALSRRRLGSIEDGRVFTATCEAVFRHGLATNDVGELVTLLNGAPDGDAALVLLGEQEAELALRGLAASSEGRRRGHQSPRATMLSALGTIRLASAARVIADCADDDQRKVLANAIRDSAAVLQQVLRAVS